LDEVAITIPLLEQHAVPSICPRPAAEPVDEYYGSSDTQPAETVDDPILEEHPHVITRCVASAVGDALTHRTPQHAPPHGPRITLVSPPRVPQ
jgi:hypothetical protein